MFASMSPLSSSSITIAPYHVYIEKLLSFGQDAKSLQLSAVLWYRNTAGQLDTKGDANSGCTARKALVAQSNQIAMTSILHVDLSFQNRYLLKGVEIRLRLIWSTDIFAWVETEHELNVKCS